MAVLVIVTACFVATVLAPLIDIRFADSRFALGGYREKLAICASMRPLGNL